MVPCFFYLTFCGCGHQDVAEGQFALELAGAEDLHVHVRGIDEALVGQGLGRDGITVGEDRRRTD